MQGKQKEVTVTLWCHIPTDVLSYIFTFVCYYTNRTVLSRVNKRFKHVANLTTSIQPKMSFHGLFAASCNDTMYKAFALETLPRGTALSSLGLFGTVTDSQLVRLSNVNLTRLKICGDDTFRDPVKEEKTETLGGLLRLFSHKLRELDLRGSECKTLQCVEFISFVEETPQWNTFFAPHGLKNSNPVPVEPCWMEYVTFERPK
jgi:hypothetical protein